MFLKPSIISAKILQNLINDILDVSQIKEGKLRIINIFFNLKKLAKETLELIRIQAKKRGIKVILSIDPTLPS